ncbi:hypothetical protein QOT17_010087 [Balamuthia mandrillaris]
MSFFLVFFFFCLQFKQNEEQADQGGDKCEDGEDQYAPFVGLEVAPLQQVEDVVVAVGGDEHAESPYGHVAEGAYVGLVHEQVKPVRTEAEEDEKEGGRKQRERRGRQKKTEQ